MKEYLITFISAAFVASIIGYLSPQGEKGGIAKHIRLITSLAMTVIICAPIQDGIQQLMNWTTATLPPWETEEQENGYEQQLQQAIDAASKDYFLQMLTQALEKEFEMEAGTVRCRVQWQEGAKELTPRQVTVFLSASSIWKNPENIELFVEKLLNCQCDTAIE